MPIEQDGVQKEPVPRPSSTGPRGWLEFDVKFLAEFFRLEPTGEARVTANGKIQVAVAGVEREGDVVEGLLHHVPTPAGWRKKGSMSAPGNAGRAWHAGRDAT